MISITWVSRNDDHGENLVERIQISLDALKYYRDSLGLDIDLIFVEWNPSSDKPRLRQVLDVQIPIRWYEVPFEVHQGFPNWEMFKLWNHIATNVGMRRARGNWVLCTTHDIVFSEEMAVLLKEESFDEDSFYRATRIDGICLYIAGQSTPERIEYMKQHITRTRYPASQTGIFTRGCGDFILMPREKYHQLQGYTEWSINGMYFDGLLLYRATAFGMRQVILSELNYHIEHSSGGLSIFRNYPYIHHNLYKQICGRMMKEQKPIWVNPDGWGLGSLREEQIESNVWRIMGPYKQPILEKVW